MPCPPRANQVDKDEDLRFALLVEAFSDVDSSGVALVTDLVVFFNTILSSAFEFEERVMLRTEMISAGMLEAMQRVRDYFGLSKVRYRRDVMGRDRVGWDGMGHEHEKKTGQFFPRGCNTLPSLLYARAVMGGGRFALCDGLAVMLDRALVSLLLMHILLRMHSIIYQGIFAFEPAISVQLVPTFLVVFPSCGRLWLRPPSVFVPLGDPAPVRMRWGAAGRNQDDDSEGTEDEWGDEGGRRSRRSSLSSDGSMSTIMMDAALVSETNELAAQVREGFPKIMLVFFVEGKGGGGGSHRCFSAVTESSSFQLRGAGTKTAQGLFWWGLVLIDGRCISLVVN